MVVNDPSIDSDSGSRWDMVSVDLETAVRGDALEWEGNGGVNAEGFFDY